MSTPIINLNDKNYYFVEDVKNACPAFFYGCSKSSRMIVNKRKITCDNYTYATYAPKTLKWRQSDNSIKSAKLLLTCEWVEQNIPGWKSDNGNITNDVKLDLDIVPPILQLKDEKKFKDENEKDINYDLENMIKYKELELKYEDLQNKLEILQNKLEKSIDDHEINILRKDMKIQELEHIIKYKELELKCKDMEIELLKSKLLQ